MSSTPWRLLVTGASDGPTNMAIDHAIMEAVAEGRVPPTLRFYAWEPACLTLGFTQPIADVDRARLKSCGWDVVRRITGGRAILHTDELTYSVTVKDDNPVVAGDIVQSYRYLSKALRHGLERLGAAVEAERRLAGVQKSKGPVCFEVPSHYEITAGGKKLIGSAQVRRLGIVLQHGSIPLTGDISRICEVLSFESEEARGRSREHVHRRATTIEEVLGHVITWDDAVEIFTASFADTFDLTLIPGDLTPGEQTRAAAIREEQYAAETWNARL
ncbi:MAG TPA: lipoate--protein ligase family protein [Aggregatilinea sp.]|uniref:lipoate--protein ligase family protein n=1 Tax=Aggregatilinea sp. TaxID=2806333 RepID=UPI002CED1358|nr:lipoate--protein ligase family protein [Aggregatilinea sp.]HML22208.1 lipoate--protein ligase family protein [Aggregatilinea sp.]